jgi:hypothetical protein
MVYVLAKAGFGGLMHADGQSGRHQAAPGWVIPGPGKGRCAKVISAKVGHVQLQHRGILKTQRKAIMSSWQAHTGAVSRLTASPKNLSSGTMERANWPAQEPDSIS